MPRKSSPSKRPAPPNTRGRSAAAASVAATPLPTLFRVRKPSLPRRNNLSKTKLSDALSFGKRGLTSPNHRPNAASQQASPAPSPAASASALTTPPKSVTVVTQPPQATPKSTRPKRGLASASGKPVTARQTRVPTPPKIQKKLHFPRRRTPPRAPAEAPPGLPTTPVTGGPLRAPPEDDDEEDCFATLAPCTESDEEYDDDIVDVRADRLISPSNDPLISHVLQLFPPEG